MGSDAERFYERQLELLERVAKGVALPELLDGVVRMIEERSGGMSCSILLLDAEAGVVRHGAAPNLPLAYTQAVDGASIGPYAGSCGRAAYLGERVIVRDIATHPDWAEYKHLALPYGIRSCWSSPIFSPEGEVLGTFAMYYREIRTPTATEISWVDAATHLAAIAIAHDRARHLLESTEARARQLAKLYAVSNSVNEAVVRLRDPGQLYDCACRIAVEQGIAQLAWVGVYDVASGCLRPVARFGADEGYVDQIMLALDDERINKGPAGRVMRSGQSAVSNDVAADPDFYWKAEALSRELRSCAVFPLQVAGRTLGVFAMYARQVGAFQREEIQVLEALAADIAFGVESVHVEWERRRLVGELAERVKELTLLHQAARLLQSERPFDEALLSELVLLLPCAWRYPELCEARIVWRGVDVCTPGFRDTPWKLGASFGAAPERGRVEVAYRESVGEAPDTFLPEEVELLVSLTDMLSAHLSRHEATVALARSEERLSAVIEHTPNVAIQWYDQHGRVLYSNQASERLFGYVAADAKGKTLDELNFSRAEAGRFMSALNEVASTNRAAGPMEFEFFHPDGKPGSLLSTIFEIPLSAGERCFVCMDVDLTEVKRMQQAVRSGEQLRELIYRSVVDVIFCIAVEPEGIFRFLSVNPAFLESRKLAEMDVIGKRIQEVLPEASASTSLEKYREAIAGRCSISWEEVSVTATEAKLGEVTVAPIFDAAGRCTNLVGTVRDITPRKRAEEERRRLELQLQQAQRMQSLGTLAGGIAHDFNNILTAIAGNAELGLLDAEPGGGAHESFIEIRTAARRAADLVRQILAFSRQDAPDRRVLDVRGVIEEALRLLRATLPATIELETRLSSDTPKISADASQIHQVLMNLVTNASHAMASRCGVLSVTTERLLVDATRADESPELREGAYACISVSDTGSGMDAATLARAFEPFFTTKPKGQGTGLGLSVVHGIMQSHHGSVTLESAPERGTTFRLYFPAAAARAEEPVEARPEPPRSAGHHILYVDDEEALVFLATRMLPRSGYRVTAYSDALRALSDFRARANDFDAVVTDISMPGLSGPDLVRELWAIRPDVPVLMTSGCISAEDVECARRLGVGDLLLKPNSIDELTHALHKRLSGVSASSTLARD